MKFPTILKRPFTCKWTFDEYECIYETACGHSFYFTDGTLQEQDGFKFCPYCQYLIEPVLWEIEPVLWEIEPVLREIEHVDFGSSDSTMLGKCECLDCEAA